VRVTGDRDGRVVFCTAGDPQLGGLDGATVAVEIDGCDAAIEHDWYITALGTARDITTDDGQAALRTQHRDRRPENVGRWIVVEPHTFVTRRDDRVTALDGWFAGVPGS
jgi:hypothetical protein